MRCQPYYGYDNSTSRDFEQSRFVFSLHENPRGFFVLDFVHLLVGDTLRFPLGHQEPRSASIRSSLIG